MQTFLSCSDRNAAAHFAFKLQNSRVMNAFRSLGTVRRGVLELRPRRALLYVPGDSEKKIRKAAEDTDADVVCLDMEDAVAHSCKAAAREGIATALSSLSFGRSERAVRINGCESSYVEDDLRALFAAKELPDALVAPKIDSVEHVAWLFARARSLVGARLLAAGNPLALITMCESGQGMLNLRDIFEACLKEYDQGKSPLKLEGCIFGADDFCASLGMKRQPGTDDTNFARRWVAVHARSFGLQPIDQVFIDYKNHHGHTVECEEGRRIGFTGKQVIHPSQVEAAQAAFSPDPHDVEEAKELVKAFEEHQWAGKGAFVFRDKMIDNPTFLQAKNLLEFARRIGAA